MTEEVNLRRLVAFIDDCGGIDRAARRLGVRTSTLKKIISGKPLPLKVRRKIAASLETAQPSNPIPVVSPRTRNLKIIHNLYLKERSLAAVGKKIGVTRERVRQLLTTGSQLGLFDYRPLGRDHPSVPKEQLLETYKACLSLARVAKINKISIDYLRKLLSAYGITEKELWLVRSSVGKAKCIGEYHRIKDDLGYHPTTTVLQAHSTASRQLYKNVAKLWGSFNTFRQELNIPWPPTDDEQQRPLGLILTMQRIERIRQCLSQSAGPVSSSQIALQSDIPQRAVQKILGRLVATGEISKEGRSYFPKNRLS